MMGQGFGAFGMMGGGSFMMILFLTAIGFLFYLAMNRQTPAQKDAHISPQSLGDSDATVNAAEIVRLCYARGEISFEEFQTILKNIQS